MMYNIISETAELYATAALMEPPPKVAQQITQWVRKMYLSHILYMLQKNGQNVKTLKAAGIVVNKPINIVETEPQAEFPFDTSGWRYEPVIKRFEQSPELRENISVHILPSHKPPSVGSWRKSANLLMIMQPVPAQQELSVSMVNRLMAQLHNTVEHELVHASQSFISDMIYRHNEPPIPPYAQTLQFGLPTKNVRSPHRDPEGHIRSPITNKRLKRPQQVHELRDIEFYPSLLDAFNRFKRYVILHSLTFQEEYPLNKAIKIYVGTNKVEKDFISSTFFKKLKRHNAPKWRKAVKEFINAVLSDVWFKENLV